MARIITCPKCGDHDARVVTGHVVPMVFDGILIWTCPNAHSWPRFSDEEHTNLYNVATNIIERGIPHET